MKRFALDGAKTTGVLAAATFAASLLAALSDSYTNVSMIYLLAVVVVSRITLGYCWGIIASCASVAGVNYFFTYPYFTLNFSMGGYPFTFVTMLLVSIITSALTVRIQKQAHVLVESEKEKIRSNLLRAISHDLRTPLTGILGSSAVLQENKDTLDDVTYDRLVSGIHENAQWLIHMVENLLSVTRISGGAATLSKMPQAVEEIIAEAVGRLRGQYPEARLTVLVPEEFLQVPMDALLIEQVIFNLVENAIKHADSPEPIGLTVTARPGWVVFEVSDSGVGIPPHRLPTLLEGLSSGESTRSDANRGMGLGLSICKSIIAAHGGRLTVANRPEGGALFRFILPTEEEEKHEQ